MVLIPALVDLQKTDKLAFCGVKTLACRADLMPHRFAISLKIKVKPRTPMNNRAGNRF